MILKKENVLLAGQNLSPDQMELKKTDRRDFMECVEMFCAPKTCAGSKECYCKCAGQLPAPQHVGLWGMRMLIVSIRASLRGADPPPVEINARASLYFKRTGLNSSLHVLEFVLWCDHLVSSYPHNCYFCCCKCASQRRVLGFFLKYTAKGFQHL